MFIKYTPKYSHIKVVPILSNGSMAVTAGNVTLTPGTNEISDKDWNAIKAHLESEIADGTVTPFSVAKNGASNAPKVKTLKDVPAATATKIIAECSSKETLRKWFKDNLSDELSLLVLKRMRQLNMDIDEIEGGENTLSDSDITVEFEKDNENENSADDEEKNKCGKNGGGGKNNGGKGKTGSDNGNGNPDPNANGSGGNSGNDGTPKFDDPNAKVE